MNTDMKTKLSYASSLFFFCLPVFGHQVRLATYSTDTVLSGVIYSDYLLEKSNVSSALSCALLCRRNPHCLSMSVNLYQAYCQIFGTVYCNRNQGNPSNGTNYYIIGFGDFQPHSIYLKCKFTKQSSTGFGGLSSFATDGIWEANWAVSVCSHTNYENRPWWYVDLEKNYIVYKIKLLNRLYAELRLSRLILSVGEDLQSMIQCGYHANLIPSAQNVTITCVPPTKGRFVRILMDKTHFLTICEIGVYGHLAYD